MNPVVQVCALVAVRVAPVVLSMVTPAAVLLITNVPTPNAAAALMFTLPLFNVKPAEAAVEQTFVNKDGVATLKLGQARGVAMLAPAMFGISVAEYAPNQVKKTVVGAGHADKNQIAVMLKILLPKAEPKSADAADALAIAITHAHHRQGAALRLRVAGL